jgi:DNA-binding MarR family transcriptional regulator
MSVLDDPDDSEAPALGAGFMLWQVTNGWQRTIRAALSSTGLTYVQIVLLCGLKDKLAGGTAVSQAALAQALGADPMMTSQVLRTLETAGLVKRERNPADTRSRLLSLTTAGKAQLAAALPLITEVDREFFDVLGRREDKFLKAMRRLWRKQRLVGLAPEPPTKPTITPVPNPATPPKKKRAARRKMAPAG